MDVTFTGVGEAFDENLSNTSILVSEGAGDSPSQVLLDCGFTAAHAFWRLSPSPLDLGAVWVSHFHGDHFFGLPLLLLRSWEEGRSRELIIVGQEGIEERILSAMDLAYPGFFAKIRYPVVFRTVTPGEEMDLLGCRWSFAETGHSKTCLAVRIDWKGKSLFYSGDGSPTEAGRALATGCDLVVHEAFGVEQIQAGHGSVGMCLELAREAGAKALALVHMNRDARRSRGDEVRKILKGISEFKAFLPEPGDRYIV